MASSGFQGWWQWPEDIPAQTHRTTAGNRQSAPEPTAGHNAPADAGTQRPQARHWRPRTCRICLETVLPTFHPPTEGLPGIFQSGPSVTYDSEEGRLIRPCKCKGSQKYVHEGCLQAWRHADPGYGRRNFWQCPTCGFRYRLERMEWGRWVSSTAAQIFLTISILLLAMFMLGFIADPIINIYLDPYGTLSPLPTGRTGNHDVDETSSWLEHFVKGFAGLGLLSFLKVILTSPWQWFNLRHSGIVGGTHRGGNTGRDRLANISWLVVLIGVGTFLYAVWKGVRAWSRRTLEKAGERVMDVQGDDNDDEDEDNVPAGAAAAPDSS